MTTNDYPIQSWIAERGGTTRFTVTISAAGVVTSCKIMEGSGTPELDEATCRLVTDRARFIAGTDSEGRPTEGTYTTRVRWIIPPLDPAVAPAQPLGNPGSWATELDYPRESLRKRHEGDAGFLVWAKPDGRPELCEVLRSSGFQELDRRTCELMMTRALFRVVNDSGGMPARTVWRSVVHWALPHR